MEVIRFTTGKESRAAAGLEVSPASQGWNCASILFPLQLNFALFGRLSSFYSARKKLGSNLQNSISIAVIVYLVYLVCLVPVR